MATAAHILNFYQFKQLIPGMNDTSLKFDGPGIVVIAMSLPETSPGEKPFKILSVHDAKNDALAIAKTLLSRPREQPDHLFALLGVIPESKKAEALQALQETCKTDNAWASRRDNKT